MTAMTDVERETLYQFLHNLFNQIITTLNVTVTMHTDFEEFYQTIKTDLSGGLGEIINPSFDYRYNDLGPENAFWFKVTDGREIVGLIASKHLPLQPGETLADLIRTHRFWYTKLHDVNSMKIISLVQNLAEFSGVLGVGGVGWVHPKYRKVSRLSSYLALLSRFTLLRRFEADITLGTIKQALYERNMAHVYVLDHVQPLVDITFPEHPDRDYRMHLMWSTRSESFKFAADPNSLRSLVLTQPPKLASVRTDHPSEESLPESPQVTDRVTQF